ncbi:MAG: aminoacyl-tRNA hydrolase [Candidatus Zixiibacteriota bacterium]
METHTATGLIVGLGNIGERYAGTRHNFGFDVVEHVRRELKLPFQPTTKLYDWALKEEKERQLVLAWPKTYMNRSGAAVQVLLEEHGLEPQQMLVVVDDFNLPLGRIRIRADGSDGGHNGLASIIETLETEDFPRLRCGIGPVPDGIDPVEFVLSRFTKEEKEPTEKMIALAADAALYTVRHRLDEAMSKYNVNPA